MILTIRTDKPEAEVGLYDSGNQAAYKTWQAHRQLGQTLHNEIKALLDSKKLGWEDISGIVFYKGPGSFTGLRIGASVANALAYSNDARVASVNGETWIKSGLKILDNGQSGLAVPEYGSEPRTTSPKK